MSFEEGADWNAVRIDVCEPRHVIRVTVSGAGQGEDWLLEARLAESDGERNSPSSTSWTTRPSRR
jgi:hypothetical protein